MKTFKVVLAGYMPSLYEARAMDETLLRPIRYCDSSWKYGTAALRQDLIDLSKSWTQLGLSRHCLYQPTSEELSEHAKQYEDFETAQQLKMVVKHALNADSDGWVPFDEWAAAKYENTRLFGLWKKSIKEIEESESWHTHLWPFNEVSAVQEDEKAAPNSE